MAASDSTVVFSQIDGSFVVSDGGANTLTFIFMQSDIEWTIETAPYTEARERNKHRATPVLRKTGDGNVTGSGSLLVASFLGSADETPYDVLTLTGTASAWATRAAGDKIALRGVLTVTGGGGGATQTVTFAYMVFTNVKVSPSGGDGLFMLTFDFVDHENYPVTA